MAIYKRGREFELGTTEHKSSKWPERNSNPGPPEYESDALTTRPRCLLSVCMCVCVCVSFVSFFLPYTKNVISFKNRFV